MNKFKKITAVMCTIVLVSAFHVTKVFASTSSQWIYGVDRFETSLKISSDSWKNANTIIIASGYDFPDALCASVLSKKYDAPILLVKTQLDSGTINEISRLGAKNAIILGGTGAVSSTLQTKLTSLGLSVSRVAGADRFETSLEISKLIGVENGVIIASGIDFPDALSIAPIAAIKGMPIILTGNNFMPQKVNDYLNLNKVATYYVIGGTGAISNSQLSFLGNYTRISGADRYSTNLKVVNYFKNDLNLSNVYLATGNNFPDAISASGAAAKVNSPVVLANDITYTPQSFLADNSASISTIKILGGPSIITNALVQNLLNLNKASEGQVLGYATKYSSYDTSSLNSISNNYSTLNTVATFTYASDGYGNLSGGAPTDQIAAAKAKDLNPIAVVTNGFDADVARQLLENPAHVSTLVNNLLNECKTYGYSGVNVDIENIYSSERPYYTSLLSQLHNVFSAQGLTVSAAVPAKTADNPHNGWNGAYDYSQIGAICDDVVIMTYDEHWFGGDAGPIASINWVQAVEDYSLTQIPKEKLLIGLAAYGYDWTLNGGASSFGSGQAQSLAASHNTSIRWDDTAKAPYFTYRDSKGLYHTAYFENYQSISYKLDTIKSLGISGVAIWRLGLEDSNYFSTIKSKLSK